MLLCLMLASPVAADSLSFTVNTSEPVVVTGSPRIVIDIGGVARYATFASGSGTTALTFAYAVQSGDFDANGIALASPLDLNGGALTDLAGNPPSALSFTLPDTSAIKVQTYTASFTTSPITNTNANAVSFAIAKAPTGASFSYAINSSGGAGTVSGSGTVSGATHTVSNVDVSALPSGTLTLAVTVSTAAGGTGAAKAATSTPSFTGILDSLPATASAFSVRRLRQAFAGPLLRVRRSADNAEQDIGATVAGNLNTAALATFCGAATCFVSTWYDQSGGGRNATQATAASQPRIAASGVLEAVNTRPAIKGDGVDDQMLFPLGPLVAYPVSINLVLAKPSASDRGSWVKLGGLTAISGGIAIGVGGAANFYSSGQNIIGLKETVVWMPSSTVLASSAIITFTQDATTNSTAMFQSGAAVSPVNGASAPLKPNGTTGYLFGHLFFNGEQRWSRNPIAEVVLVPSLLSTSARQALERDQGGYYGISVP
jgi:hypothetical protein